MSLNSSFTLIPHQASSAFSSFHTNISNKKPSLLVQALSKDIAPDSSKSTSSRLIRGTILPNQRANRILHEGDTTSKRSYAPFEPLINQRNMGNGTISPLSQEEYQAWKKHQTDTTAPAASRESSSGAQTASSSSSSAAARDISADSQRNAKDSSVKAPRAIRAYYPFEPLVCDRNLHNGAFSLHNDEDPTTITTQQQQQYYRTEIHQEDWKRRCQRAEIAKCDARKQMLGIMDENRRLNIQMIHHKAKILTDHLQEENQNVPVSTEKGIVQESSNQDTVEKTMGEVPTEGILNSKDSHQGVGGDGNRDHSTKEIVSSSNEKTPNEAVTGESPKNESALLACGESSAEVNVSSATHLSSPKRQRLSFTDVSTDDAATEALPANEKDVDKDTTLYLEEEEHVDHHQYDIQEVHESSLTALDISAITASSSLSPDAVAKTTTEEEPAAVVVPESEASTSHINKSEVVEYSSSVELPPAALKDDDATGTLCSESSVGIAAKQHAREPSVESEESQHGKKEEHAAPAKEAHGNKDLQSSPFSTARDTFFEAMSSSDPGPLQDVTNDLSSIGSNDMDEEEKLSGTTQAQPPQESQQVVVERQAEIPDEKKSNYPSSAAKTSKSLSSPPLTRSAKKKRKSGELELDREKKAKEGKTTRRARAAKMEPTSSKAEPGEEESDALASSLEASKAHPKVTKRGRRRRGTIVDDIKAPVIKKTRRNPVRR